MLGLQLLASLTASLAVAYPARPPLRELRLAAAPPPAGFEWGAFDRAGLLEKLDTQVVSRAVRLANHVPASASLAYFGLISTTMMSMPMPLMTGGVATLRSVITRGVGPTTNEAFAALFPTLVTPANFVFLIWPAISLLQLLTLASSALPLPGRPPLKQDSLTALAAANFAATAWLLFASNAAAGALPLASSLTLPLVPLLAGFPLRSAGPPLGLQRLAFSVYAAFTTLASFLALAVELQHGGRDPAERQPRPSRDAAEIQPRPSRGIAEMQHGGRLPIDAEHRVRAYRLPLELG